MKSSIKIIENPRELQQYSRQLKSQGKKIGLVPTMGCLHEGHLSLVRAAQKETDFVIVSLFVNPTQFGPNEDFDKYPRVFEQDCAALEKLGVDCIFSPTPTQMYPEGFHTNIRVQGVSEGLCGASRPGHFDGVATVCMKLFQASLADTAIFGEKDFQQLQVVRTLVRDLNVPIEVVAHPIVREADGLAMSSRNRYLSDKERSKAVRIFEALSWAQSQVGGGKCPTASDLKRDVMTRLESAGFRLDYVEIVDSLSLLPLGEEELPKVRSARILVAAYLGKTRLIDNMDLMSSDIGNS